MSSRSMVHFGLFAGIVLSALQCGGDAGQALVVEHQSSERIAGRFTADGTVVEFAAASSAPLVGDVGITVGSLTYDLHYDYAARTVVADGHGGALDRPTHELLRDVVAGVAEYLGPSSAQPLEPGQQLPLQEQMLYAGLVLLQESGGMPLSRLVFELETGEVDKSLGNDGVTCIERGSTYGVSFDESSGTTVDDPRTADVEECNGKCGPGCAPLTPWAMWTLDCLEHDACCSRTDESLVCWTPLGQCGDEYVDAEADFLRGFDPLSSHCGG
jgi:hypothetical protein